MTAWGSAAFDSNRKVLAVHGGGHTDYAGNEVYGFDLDPANPGGNLFQWRILGFPSTSRTGNEDYADGTPSSSHTYSSWIYNPHRDRYVRCPGVAIYDSGGFTSRLYELDASVNSPTTAIPTYWTQKSTSATGGGADGVSAYDPSSNLIYTLWSGGSSTQGLRSYNGDTDTWTTLTTFDSGAAVNAHQMTGCVAPAGVGFLAYAGAGTLQVKKLSDFTFAGTSDTTFGATGDTNALTPSGPGLIWDPYGSVFVFWSGTQTGGTDNRDWYTLDVNTKVMTRHAGTGDTPDSPQTNGTFGRFAYIGYGLCALVNSTTSDVYILRVSFPPATLEQAGFIFRNDDGSESTATSLASQNTNASLVALTNARLRMLLNGTNDPASAAYRLEFRKTGGPNWLKVNP